MHPEILYVEDNPAEAFLLGEAIRKLDADLRFTNVMDGESAISFLREARSHPCVIVLDLGLPRIDGVQVFKAVKENPEFDHVPVIVFAENEGRRRIQSTGKTATLFLTKPMDLDGYAKIAEQIMEICATTPGNSSSATA